MSENTLNESLKRRTWNARNFTPHDLRATARSYLAALGVDVVVAEKCLGHKLGGLLDVYDKGGYMSERRRALELWASFIEQCEQPRPENVTRLRVAA
jgi:integrase